MRRLYVLLLAVSVGVWVPINQALPALATSTVRSPAPKADVFSATTANRAVASTNPGAPPSPKESEIASMRGQNSKTFASGGHYVTEIYSSPINFRDAKGGWQAIDDSLVATSQPGFARKNKANAYTVLLPQSLSAPIRLNVGGASIDFQLVGASGTISTAGTSATYGDAFTDTSVRYEAESTRLKEAISLSSGGGATTFTYKVKLPKGWAARAGAQGTLQIVDSKGTVQARLDKPFMYDSSRAMAPSSAVTMTLSGTPDSPTVVVAADKAWISSPGRAFPVTIDPTVDTNVNYYDPHDCFIQNTNPNGSFCSSQGTTSLTTNPLGFDGTTINRNLYWFGTSTTRYSIPVPNANILDAELDFTLASSTSGSAVPITVYPITQAWDDAGASWNDANTGVAWTTPGGTVGSAITTVNVGPAAGSFAFYNLTSTIQNWVNTNTADNGFLLRAANEGTNALLQVDNDNFGTSDTDPGRPHLRVQWNGWGGLQRWFKFQSTQLDDRMTIAVNVANGQLVVHNMDLSVHGVGQNLSLDRYYNSLSDIQWHLGTGWNLNAGCDVRIDLDDHDGVAYWGPDGYEVLFRNNGSGGYTTPPGVNADLVKNGDGTFTLTFRGSNLKYNFQTGGCLQSEVDRNNNTISMSYNGSLQTITDTENRATNFVYNSPVSSDFITQITDSAGRKYQYGYDSSGDLTSYTDANNKVTSYSYNANLQMSQIQDANGNTTNFTYGSSYPQQLTQISQVDSTCAGGVCNTNFAYNTGAGPCTSTGIWMNTVVTDPNGNSTTYCYDNLGRIREVRDPNNHKLLQTWTSNNDVASSTDNMGNVSSMSYDANFNLTQAQLPPSAPGQTGAASTWTYNTPSTVTGHSFLSSSGSDAMTNCGAFTYDPNGNTTNDYSGQSGNCDGHTGGTNTCTAYQGDPSGTCGATATVSCTNAKQGEACWVQDGDAHRTNFAYDSTGNLHTVTPPSPLGTSTFTVDSLSRVTSILDGKGQTTRYSYDGLDRVTQVLFGGATSCTSFATCTVLNFDADGNLSSRTDATGQYTFSYNARNLPLKKILPSSSWNCSGQGGITFGYDNAGNLTSYCDVDGQVTYTYDAANRATGVALPTGSCTGTLSFCTQFAYDNDDRLTTVTFPGGATQNYSYDNAGNLLSAIGKSSNGTVLTSFTYTYAQGTADRGIRFTMTENDALASNLTTSYSYDSLGRLTSATNSQRSLSYGYDAAGNRTSDPLGTYQFNSADELCGSSCASPTYHYDADGNLTSGPSGGSLTYNSQNQTTAVTWSGHTLSPLAYTGLGQSERTAAGGTTLASSALGTQISQSTAGPSYFLRTAKGNVVGEETPDDSHWYYLRDGSGSVVAVINDSGSTVADRYGYDPYGKVTTSSGTVSNPWGYASGYLDSTGLMKFGTRYYDPNLGRWTQMEASQTYPAQAGAWSTGNPYLYAADKPVDSVDPSGRWYLDFGGTIGVILGLGAGVMYDQNGGTPYVQEAAPAAEAGGSIGFSPFGNVQQNSDSTFVQACWGLCFSFDPTKGWEGVKDFEVAVGPKAGFSAGVQSTGPTTYWVINAQ